MEPDELWNAINLKPEYMQMPLRSFRKLIHTEKLVSEKAKKFLKSLDTEIPEDAIVVITRNGFSLLTDKEGHLLSFQ
jgi:hypothetical protein